MSAAQQDGEISICETMPPCCAALKTWGKMNLSVLENKPLLSDQSANVGRNLLWMIWSGAISIVNSLLVWMFMARLRDVEELGRFTVVMGLYALFFGVCSLGLIPFLVSEISRRKKQAKQKARTISKFIGSAAVFLSISGLGCAVLMTLTGFWVSESWTVRFSVLLLSLAMIPTGLISVAEAASIAYGQTRLMAFVSTLENLLRTIVPLGLIWFDFEIPAICVSFVAVRILALLIYCAAVNRQTANFSFDADDFRQIAKASPTFAATIILASINWQAAIILLGYFGAEAESAKYGAASRFLIPVSILMASYAGVIQPVLTEYLGISKRKFGLYLSKMASYPLVLSVLAAVVSPALSGRILTLLFGEKYANAATALDILAVSVAPFCLVMVVSRGLVALNSQKVDLLANALGVAACFAFGWVLIPRYGANGAALAQLFSFLLMALVEIAYLTRKIGRFNLWRQASLSSACLLFVYIIFWKH